MKTDNRLIDQIESHHGVLLNIAGYGVFITGQAGIGKSSLALDFLHNGHSLIADDCVDFKIDSKRLVIGHCPPMLVGFLHTRELGLISLSELFDTSTWQTTIQLNFVVHLKKELSFASELSSKSEMHTVCDQSFPLLTLDINNPATIINRINTWLSMQTRDNTAAATLSQRQRVQMESLQ